MPVACLIPSSLFFRLSNTDRLQMPRQRADHDKPVLLVENEVNAQQIFRIVSYLQMLIERRFALFTLRIGKILDLVLRRRELNGHIADRRDLERTAVLARTAVEHRVPRQTLKPARPVVRREKIQCVADKRQTDLPCALLLEHLGR